ncbi:MAG: hypothetical protein A2566_00645 [Candidatus Zambryskibacteria bacterium RIFOXYD1_FULL_40_13]|nr:MAG: hypothetical protein UT25_C0001G0113 [Parcubacteria group bacterium GW2011_GWC1_39_12]KKR19637.1 MAG: hypothetical protein UT49_C0001G0113 [Parcubacteria group bacterium GW2011_GWF1_39_37]KKR35792.1 MAG: hypothetical protein UT68_C0001G0115 [Parcubacteria group bacterium GW2011_GWC2_40_10]KKR52605.1 MAG: hypothetical protein UT89_C0001G0113 [Parcubacteria group bacterium GW2011_GWE1_40_20]KKR66057.1 MAG: hypothetical protein UU06_C0006G0008 [Parcubacteria group bacterium GW2011_GWB1_40_
MNTISQENSQHDNSFILKDIFVIAVSISFAIFLANTNFLVNVLTKTKELEVVGSFVAGMFFTSIFTTAPAIATLGEISQSYSVLLTALFGAMGAVLGDLIIFRFIRDRFSDHLTELVKHKGFKKRTRVLFHLKAFRWITFLLGGLILASPFPDEIAISIFGFLHVKTTWFIPISFVFNFVGIVLIGLVATAI